MKNLVVIGKSSANIFNLGPHRHSNWELIYYTSGMGTLKIGGKDYHFKPHDIILQPPNIVHSEYSANGYSNMYLMFSYCNFTKLEPMLFEDTPANDFYKILVQLYKEFYFKSNNYINISEALLNVLYQYIISWQKKSNRNCYVEWFINVLTSNLSNTGFQFSDALKQIPFTSDHFRRIFKKETAKTPTEYLEYLRLEYSKQLLKSKTLKVKEISRLSGFDDPYYFSRVFKKYTGKCPTEFL